MAEFNPRFVAYAAAQGVSPSEALEACRARRTGRMVGFILWISCKWTEWRKLNDREPMCSLSPEDHASFDAWLVARQEGGAA